MTSGAGGKLACYNEINPWNAEEFIEAHQEIAAQRGSEASAFGYANAVPSIGTFPPCVNSPGV